MASPPPGSAGDPVDFDDFGERPGPTLGGCLEVIGLAIAWIVFLSAVSIGPYVAFQRGPLRVIGCFFTDDIPVEYATEGMTLGAFRASVKSETRNCVRLDVIDGPDGDDAIVVSPVGQRTILYRGDRAIDVITASPGG